MIKHTEVTQQSRVLRHLLCLVNPLLHAFSESCLPVLGYDVLLCVGHYGGELRQHGRVLRQVQSCLTSSLLRLNVSVTRLLGTENIAKFTIK